MDSKENKKEDAKVDNCCKRTQNQSMSLTHEMLIHYYDYPGVISHIFPESSGAQALLALAGRRSPPVWHSASLPSDMMMGLASYWIEGESSNVGFIFRGTGLQAYYEGLMRRGNKSVTLLHGPGSPPHAVPINVAPPANTSCCCMLMDILRSQLGYSPAI